MTLMLYALCGVFLSHLVLIEHINLRIGRHLSTELMCYFLSIYLIHLVTVQIIHRWQVGHVRGCCFRVKYIFAYICIIRLFYGQSDIKNNNNNNSNNPKMLQSIIVSRSSLSL